MSGRLRTFVLCGCLVLIGQPAYAHWFTWLDELSGPGPFEGNIAGFELWCIAGADERTQDIGSQKTMSLTPAEIAELQKAAVGIRWCRADRTNTIVTFAGEVGRWNDERGRRYIGDTRLTSFQVVAYAPLLGLTGLTSRDNPMGRALEFGFGIGGYRLSGTTTRDDTEWGRLSIPLRIRLLPSELFYCGDKPGTGKNPSLRSLRWRRALQAIQFRVGWDWLPGTISRLEFEGIEGPDVLHDERVFSRAIQVDVGTLVWALFQTK